MGVILRTLRRVQQNRTNPDIHAFLHHKDGYGFTLRSDPEIAHPSRLGTARLQLRKFLQLGDANGPDLKIAAMVRLTTRLGNCLYRVSYRVIERLVIDVINRKAFMSQHVKHIFCWGQTIDRHLDDKIQLVNASEVR